MQHFVDQPQDLVLSYIAVIPKLKCKNSSLSKGHATCLKEGRNAKKKARFPFQPALIAEQFSRLLKTGIKYDQPNS